MKTFKITALIGLAFLAAALLSIPITGGLSIAWYFLAAGIVVWFVLIVGVILYD